MIYFNDVMIVFGQRKRFYERNWMRLRLGIVVFLLVWKIIDKKLGRKRLLLDRFCFENIILQV